MRNPTFRFQLGFAKASVFMTFFVTLPYARAIDEIPNASEAAQLGLVIHWQAQTERTQTGSGDTGIVLWPHTKLRNEVITISVGDRVVERINANDIDVSASEKLVLTPGTGSKSTRMGIEIARKQAEKIVARYSKIGRTAKVDEFNQPITYLVAASNDGAIQALNAETGELFWSASVGNYRLPTQGPGVNDRFVTLTNGMNLYILDLVSGRVLGEKRLSESASTVAQPIGSLVYVPGIAGSIHAFEGDDLNAEPISLRFSGTLTAPVVAAHSGNFVSWPNKNHLYIAQAGRRFTLWSRIESSSTFRTMPQLTNDGFIAVTTNGMVYRVNLNRTESIVWRENLAAQVSTPPLVANGLALVVSDTGTGYALDEKTGEVQWTADLPDLKRTLAITSTRVYAQRKAGQLVAIDRSSGKTIANLNRAFSIGIFNSVNDRIILQSATGNLVCLREPDSVFPVMNVPMAAKSEVAKSDGKTMPADGGIPTIDMAPSPIVGDSIFGEPPKNDVAPAAMSDDPFAAPASNAKPAADPLNPFGT